MKPKRISARKRRSARLEPAHDAEIDGDDVAVIVDEQVPLMHVGVEEAVAERMAEERLHQPPRQLRQVVAGGAKRRRGRKA